MDTVKFFTKKRRPKSKKLKFLHQRKTAYGKELLHSLIDPVSLIYIVTTNKSKWHMQNAARTFM